LQHDRDISRLRSNEKSDDSCTPAGLENLNPLPLEHVPEKHALGLDPMGGNRFSEKDMRQQVNLEHIAIQLNRDVL
jgi:hypothetical protein